MEPDRCRLDGVDFLGAMEVDLWGRFEKQQKENEGGIKTSSKMAGGGKNNWLRGYFRAHNFRRFTATKSVYAAT